MTREERLSALSARADAKILVLDGAMGTQIQALGFDEDDFRGAFFQNSKVALKGNNDLLNLTRPDQIEAIHRRYFDAGADIVETNTFSATRIAQADYALESHASEIAREGARLARRAADAAETAQRPRGVAGAVGPTNKTLSISPDVNDPGFRDVTFEEVRAAYFEQAEAMAEFVDFFLIETVFDTLNAKAAIKALLDLRAETGEVIPIIISGTITDASGRTLSGQTPEAFWNSVRHARPWAVGLNCALGAAEMRPHIAEMSRVADTLIIAYPNAGLPNAFGEYDETPDETSGFLGDWARAGFVNVVGGCCGTTPEHIAAISKAVEGVGPRERPSRPEAMHLSGLEPFELGS